MKKKKKKTNLVLVLPASRVSGSELFKRSALLFGESVPARRQHLRGELGKRQRRMARRRLGKALGHEELIRGFFGLDSRVQQRRRRLFGQQQKGLALVQPASSPSETPLSQDTPLISQTKIAGKKFFFFSTEQTNKLRGVDANQQNDSHEGESLRFQLLQKSKIPPPPQDNQEKKKKSYERLVHLRLASSSVSIAAFSLKNSQPSKGAPFI